MRKCALSLCALGVVLLVSCGSTGVHFGGAGGVSGAGGASSGTTASTGTASAGSSGAASSSGACGTAPEPPPGTPCPSQCTGGCKAGQCVIACNGASACAAAVLTCPPGLACLVQCGGMDSCAAATVECPDLYQCSVECGNNTGTSTCVMAQVHCAKSSFCYVGCSGASSCTGTSVTCGAGACTAGCSTGAFKPNVVCGNACSCKGC